MRQTISITTATLALVASLAAGQERTRVELEANLWEPDLNGSIRVVVLNPMPVKLSN